MRKALLVTYGLLVLAVTGCTTQRITAARMMPELQFEVFTIARPTDSRWYVNLPEQGPYNALFRVDLPSPTHTFLASVGLSALPREPTSAEDLKSLAAGLFIIQDTNRFVLTSLSLDITTNMGEMAVRYTERTLDRDPPGSSGSLIIIQNGFITPHPDNRRVIVDAMYSERGLEGEINDPACVRLGENFLRGIKFRRTAK